MQTALFSSMWGWDCFHIVGLYAFVIDLDVRVNKSPNQLSRFFGLNLPLSWSDSRRSTFLALASFHKGYIRTNFKTSSEKLKSTQGDEVKVSLFYLFR